MIIEQFFKEILMQVDIGIDNKDRDAVNVILNQILADEMALYVKTLNYHWNLVGPDFDALHALFKKQYEALFDIVDLVAERIRTLGGFPLASLIEFSQKTRIKEDLIAVRKTQSQMLEQLLKDHEAITKSVRLEILRVQDDHKDLGTANMLTDNLLEVHEKIAWMLRAFFV